jgi:hypothetical protein
MSWLKGWPRPSDLDVSRVMMLSAPFEELHGAFVLLGLGTLRERAEVAPAAGPAIDLA